MYSPSRAVYAPPDVTFRRNGQCRDRNGNEAVLIGQLECKSMVRMVRRWAVVCRCMLPERARRCLSAGGRRVDEHHSANRFAAVSPTTLVDMPTLLKDLEQAREWAIP